MCSETTIQNVRAGLMANLLPIDRLREQAQRDVDIDILLTPSDDIDFLRNAYRRLVHRPASQNCINNWLGRLQDGSLSRTDVIYGIARSREGRQRNVRVLGLNDNTTGTHVIPKRKIPWWKRFFSSKSRLPKTSLSDRVNTTERKLAYLADNSVEIAEQIEFELRQIRIQLRSTQASSPRLAMNSQIQTSEIDAKLEAMNKMLGAGLAQLPPTKLERAILQLKQSLPDSIARDPNVLCNWAVFGEHPHDVARGCHNAGFEVATIGTPAEAEPYDVRSSLGLLADGSCGGIVLDSRLFYLTDREVIHGLTLVHRSLSDSGLVVIQEEAVDLAFARLRLESALTACGFNIVPQSSSGNDENLSTSVILVGQKRMASENNCDS
ncbi:DUF4214 domain-containing protein [Bremerella cremea]|uniref:DUF4214 domain-containing protein n=1 Tax=Blastopirellula marina TaxID=124 RepID=A0A2S8FVR0_9BACT|nr:MULTISPECIES: DUF4214 domain-containing protein [Pirellulaceae]PQO36272.1 hypothetical protein C5Y83_10180 [Blastopirellula marina]RCS48949.1 DUF4214 domain-containing protein [Bremerella cremea]